MKRPLLILVLVGCLPLSSFGQTSVAGKWSTEAPPVVAVPSGSEAARGGTANRSPRVEPTVDPVTGKLSIPNPFDPTGKSRLVQASPPPATSRRPSVAVDFTVAGNKLSGTVTETGRSGPLAIEEGLLTDKRFTFKTNEPTATGSTTVVWKGEFADDNTVILARSQLRPAQPSTMPAPAGRLTPVTDSGPGFPGTGGRNLPDDVKQIVGALVLHRSK